MPIAPSGAVTMIASTATESTICPQASPIPMPADDTVGGVRASTASFVLRAKHRLRRRRHKCRAGAFVYAASDPIDHVYLPVHKIQKDEV